jgi:8-amino-7-oxononanoate synthase
MPSDSNEQIGRDRDRGADRIVGATAGELAESLEELRRKNLLRELRAIPGTNFCSNDYLGLAEDERLKSAVMEAVQNSRRVGGTGSRLLSGHDSMWNELEEEFAEFAGTEAALYFSSGYAANVGLLTSVLGRDDVVFSDELNHASLIDGIRLTGARREIYPHLDLNALEAMLRVHKDERNRRVIVTESVFSMDGDIADLGAIQNLAERNGASLIVDEAHATAVHGPDGAGISAACGITKNVLATVHTCGKALASAGAFVCGSNVIRNVLINRARTFIFSTAMPPYFAGQIRAALRLAREMNGERESLLGRSRGFSAALRLDGWDVSGTDSQIIPVIVGGNEEALKAAAYLQREGFAIRAIRPPTVAEGSARLRLSLTTRIAEIELRRLQSCLRHLQIAQPAVSSAGTAAARA